MQIARLVLWSAALLAVGAAHAQPAQAPDGVNIRRVEILGLDTISEGFVRQVVKTRANQPLSRSQLTDDIRALLLTRKFLDARASAVLEDGEAVVTISLLEKPVIASVELRGNKRFTDEDLFKELSFAAGDVLDRYAVARGREQIERKYREAGYYYAQIELDENALRNERRVVYTITEGQRGKVRHIRIEGNRAFPTPQLRFKVKTPTYFPIFRAGAFDPEQAERDALELQSFYRAEGYLDARVGYQLEFENVERTDLTVVFVIDEGRRYYVKELDFVGNEVFSSERLRDALTIAPNDPLREELVRNAQRRLADLYGEIGYVDAQVRPETDFLEEPGLVRLRFVVEENKRSRFGRITIHGNTETQDRVIRRELRFYPTEDYNTVKTATAERRLRETGLFTKATITPQEDVNGFRDALVEVEEADAINLLVGVGVSTDSGLLGSFSITNRNFDLFDWPRTFGQFARGQSFRGAGQRLRLTAEPGAELSRFRIDFTEPYLLDRPLRLDTSFYLFQRGRGPYDEQRVGTTIALSRRFESGPLDGWAVEGAVRLEAVDISNVTPLAARDIQRDEGGSALTSVKGTIVRDTTDSRLLPSEGYRLSFSWEQAGALGGDFDFGRPAISYSTYRTLRTDVFERKTILAMRADAAWITPDAPVFERFYAGGFGSLRGFAFRGISPRRGIYDDVVGGDFLMLAGSELSFPLYAETIRGVTFIDMGTAEREMELKTWRVSVGFGLRIQVDFFGPVPIVLDFGIPIAASSRDDTQVFNFSVGASF